MLAEQTQQRKRLGLVLRPRTHHSGARSGGIQRKTSMTIRSFLKFSVVAATAAAVGSCAEEREPINRVQANALDKAFFVGELADDTDNPVFLSRNFVVDATESQTLVGLSMASGLERIRWHITENTLFARRAYAQTDGEPRGQGDEANGNIIAAYEIESHFDIRNAYNPSTGEELNVVEEITSDRPWNERQFFRVDWSENQVNSPAWTTMFYGQTFGDIELTPISYFESDPNSEDAPHFDAEDGYFDVTSHFLLEPEMINFGWWQLPTCMLMGFFTGSAIYSCDPQEAIVRSSYWRLDKADPDDDFEPMENSTAALDILGNPGGIGDSASSGIVTPPREQYDPGYGYTDNGLRRYMNRHNIWKQSHQTIGSCETDSDCRDVTGRSASVCLDSGSCSVPCNYEARGEDEGDRNGTDDQCENSDTDYEGSEGSQCSARDRCTIPYRDREIRTVTYHVNPEMPEDLQGDEDELGASEDLIETWNQALQVAVARAREVECRRTGGDRDDCHEEFFVTEGNGSDVIQMVSYGGWGIETPKDEADVLVTCHNPVRDYDHEACGEEGSRSRVGDVRKNFLIYWPYSTHVGYGGIGNWRGDPLTGQIVGAAATTIGRSTTTSAARVRDIALVALGELDMDDITDGVPAALYQKMLRDGRKPKALSKAEIERRLNAIDVEQLDEHVSFNLNGLSAENPTEALLQVKTNTIADPQLSAQQLLEIQAAARPLLGTDLEAKLIDPSWMIDAVGMSPNTQLTETVLDAVSPLRGQDMGQMAMLERALFAELGRKGVCHLDDLASIGSPDLYGMGHYYAKKYPDASTSELAELMYDDIWKETYKGIQLHEIGHSLGLLHNFTSSYDAQNYNPQYWQLRTHEGRGSASCEGEPREGDTSTVAGDTCMGPRYLDPETDDELGLEDDEPRPGIVYFGHTSTMEYQSARFFESVGLGQYDVMAMGALYGGVLQTYDARHISQADQAIYERFHDSQLNEALTTADFSGRHYTQLARELELFDANRCRNATSNEKQRAEWRIVHGKVCAPPPKDYGHWDDFVDGPDPNLSLSQTLEGRKMRILASSDVPAAGNVRWPYRFGGDMMNAYMHVNPFDSGADPYEVTMDTVARQQYNYPFIYFRSDQRTWMSRRLPSYTARMFYERLRSYHWNISFTNAFYNEITQEVPRWALFFDELRNDDNELRPYLIAEAEMFRAIADTFLLPEPGVYGGAPREFLDVFDLQAVGEEESLFDLDASHGRFLAPSFDSGPNGGGSWMYHDYVRRAGYTVEKSLASRALTDGRAVFFSVSRDLYLDDRNVNINFRSDFPDGVDRLLGGVLAEDWETVSPYILGAREPVVYSQDFWAEEPEGLPQDARPLFPNIGYNQQIPTIIYAYLFGRINGDQTLANKIRIWLDGSVSGEFDVPEAEQVRFTDPGSGITYIARSYGPDDAYDGTVDRGIGSRMLMRANDLLARTYETEVDEEGALVADEFGRPTLVRDDNGQAVPSSDDAAATLLRRYVGLLDANVQISTLLGHGPYNWR